MVTAAGDRPLIEMGSRRTHEQAAVASARAAYIAGFASTSNLRARQQYGIPSAGTSAHSFTLVHDSERHAFATQVEALGKATTLLVDTYDVPRAVRTAIEVAGQDLGAVRIDSGDLPVLARQVRELLDSLGATHTRIVLTGDLDEYSIAALAAVPVDGYGVGTSLVTGSGAPTAAMVYKLVARAAANDGDSEMVPVAKRSVGKPGRGGRKWAVRHRDEDGIAQAERISLAPPDGGPLDRELLVPLVTAGEIVGRAGAEAARVCTGRRWPSCRRTRCSCPAATRPSPPCSSRTAASRNRYQIRLATGPPSGVSSNVPVPTGEFEDFYEASYGRVVALVAAMVGDRYQAEDIAQEAFARALTRWSRVARYDLPEAWVRRVAIRLTIGAADGAVRRRTPRHGNDRQRALQCRRAVRAQLQLLGGTPGVHRLVAVPAGRRLWPGRAGPATGEGLAWVL